MFRETQTKAEGVVVYKTCALKNKNRIFYFSQRRIFFITQLAL
jgi:hypothetical protein